MLILKGMVGSPLYNKQHVAPNSTLCDEPYLLHMINIMQLPRTKLMTFNRDPLEFWMLMRSFDNSIGSAAIDDSAKLNRLFQYCKGEALKVIKCCAIMSPSAGYAKAGALLKERFGDDYKISERWVHRAECLLLSGHLLPVCRPDIITRYAMKEPQSLVGVDAQRCSLI